MEREGRESTCRALAGIQDLTIHDNITRKPIMDEKEHICVTLVGAGVIGLSLAALHLTHLASPSLLTIVDVRPDLEAHVAATLPTYLPPHLVTSVKQIRLTSSLPEAVKDADIVQESGPENLDFKTSLWAEVEKHAPKEALLWTSTSGIPASKQVALMHDKSRLLVVHPFNPPHILPLLEVVPSPRTSQTVITSTLSFWRARGREPILLTREVTGFVAGRLAWALLREAIHLVADGVVTVPQLDRIMETSMGPRWAYAGPFKSFHAGGGPGGLEALFRNVGGTVQACWDEGGKVSVGDGWEDKVFGQARDAYGMLDLEERDRANRRILEVVEEVKRESSGG
jgi:3-hydroxyacyl-CoA dehydrogenase